MFTDFDLFLIIANIISFVSACFTIASSVTKDEHRTYWYQVGQCLTYAAASYFFGVYASIVMMLINSYRNYLVAAEKYSRNWMLICSISSLVLGLLINGNSMAGYLSIFMTVYYTVSSFYLKKRSAVKINLAIDLAMWFVYDNMVHDISNGIVDFAGTVLAIITLIRIIREERAAKLSENKDADD